MNEKEEIAYLTDLLLQATRWQVSEGEELDPLHLEVKDRLARLTGNPSVNVEGVTSDKVTDAVSHQSPDRLEQMREYGKEYSKSRVRIRDPKTHKQLWVRIDQVEKKQLGQKKWQWVLKDCNETPKDADSN